MLPAEKQPGANNSTGENTSTTTTTTAATPQASTAITPQKRSRDAEPSNHPQRVRVSAQAPTQTASSSSDTRNEVLLKKCEELEKKWRVIADVYESMLLTQRKEIDQLTTQLNLLTTRFDEVVHILLSAGLAVSTPNDQPQQTFTRQPLPPQNPGTPFVVSYLPLWQQPNAPPLPPYQTLAAAAAPAPPPGQQPSASVIQSPRNGRA